MTLLSLVGREWELAVLDDLVARVGEFGGALVVRGEAGIGKSALLEAASTRAKKQGMTVLTTVGVESEAHLPFAGLHQLLRPTLRLADDAADVTGVGEIGRGAVNRTSKEEA